MKVEKDKDIRIDKYLWSIRIYKTRSIASEAIAGGKVKLNGDSVKSSKKVKIGEQYLIKRAEDTLEIQVLKLIEKRVSATIAQECYQLINIEKKEVRKTTSVFFESNIVREKGKGRPTKRERREIDEFIDDDF